MKINTFRSQDNLQVDLFPNIAKAFFSFAQSNPTKTAYSQAILGETVIPSQTYEQVGTRVSSIAKALSDLGVTKGSSVAIISSTRPEWLEADLAILSCGGIVVSVYQSLPAHDIAYILFDSHAEIIFAENEEQVSKLLSLQHEPVDIPATEDRPAQKARLKIRKIISFEACSSDELVLQWSDVTNLSITFPVLPELVQSDIAALVYTSGTTGPPKGVIQTHGNHLANVRQAFQCGMVHPGSSITLFLPLAHSFAKLMGYIGFLTPVSLAFPAIYDRKTSRVDPRQILSDIQKLNSEIVPVVPRFLEKMRDGIEAKARKKGASPMLLRLCVESSRSRFYAKKNGTTCSLWDQAAVHGTAALRRKIRLALFGEKFRFAVSGGAKLPLEVAEYFAALDIVILEGYGLTETCVATNVNRFEKNKLGTVGPVLTPDIELKLAEDGEVLFRGPNVSKGYFGRPTATSLAWDSCGWFHTGDLGSLDADQYLSIVGRKKEILVTSGGKKIAPLDIEHQLANIPLISQALLIGDGRPYCVALLTLNKDTLSHWAEKNNFPANTNWQSFEPLRTEISQSVETLNSSLSSFETIKNFLILGEEFSVENGFLTPTLKVKRNAITQRFSTEIERLYQSTHKGRSLN